MTDQTRPSKELRERLLIALLVSLPVEQANDAKRDIDALVAKARQEERERCARMAETAYRDGDTPTEMRYYDGYNGFLQASRRIATKIRALKREEPPRA